MRHGVLVSAWLAKLGARPVGVDITPAQLATARRMMSQTGIEFPLIEADAARTGLPDACCDLVVSEYGASIWVDPYRWIPEAARLLRPGGRLVFLCNSTLVILCSGDDELAEDAASCTRSSACTASSGRRRCQLPHRAPQRWHRAAARANGFGEIERLVELQAPADAPKRTSTTHT